MAGSPPRSKVTLGTAKIDTATVASGTSTPRDISGEERKHGYDVELFVDSVSASPYLCCVCMNVVVDCHETSCGHIFCGPCIKRALSSDDKFRCPIDRTTNIEVHPSRFVNRAVFNLQVKCPNHQHGCDWQGALKDLIDVGGEKKKDNSDDEASNIEHQNHYKNCPFTRVICENCGVSVSRIHFEDHAHKCPSTCPFCIKHMKEHHDDPSVVKPKNGTHVSMCPRAVIECPDGCKYTMKREDLTRHLSEDCRERMVTCPYSNFGCSSRIKLKHVQNHLKYNSSSHLQMKMDHTCGQVDTNKHTLEGLAQQIEKLTMSVEILTNKCESLSKTSGGEVSAASSATASPDVLILRGNNRWEVTGIFIRRSNFHAGRVCYTLTHGPCAIRWHPTLCAWLIDRRGLKYDQEASLIAYEDVSHPGLVHAPWYVFHADQHRWIESESYRVESCNLAELFFKAETICPEFFINPMTPNGAPAVSGSASGSGSASENPNSALQPSVGVGLPAGPSSAAHPGIGGPTSSSSSSSLFVLNSGMNGHGPNHLNLNLNGEPDASMFVENECLPIESGLNLGNLNFRHHQAPPGLASGAGPSQPKDQMQMGMQGQNGGLSGMIDDPANLNRTTLGNLSLNRRSKKSWRKLEVDFQ